MNATPPVSQAPSTPASVNSLKSGGQAPDFATILTSAAAKPTRKAGGHKPAGARAVGGHLPADGNVSPPAAPPVSARSAAASAAASSAEFAAGAVGNSSTAGNSVGSGTGAILRTAAKIPDPTSGSAALDPAAAAPDAPGAVPTPPRAAPAGTAAPNSGAEFAMALALPVVDPGVPGAPSALSAAGTPITGNIPAATATGATTAALADSKGAVASGAGPGTAAKHTTAGTAAAAAATAAFKAATSGSSDTDGVTAPATNAGAATNNDTAATAAAAAMSAAATGIVASGDAGFAGAADSPSIAAVGVDTPAPGAKAPGTQAQNGAPAALAATRPAAAGEAARGSAQPVSTFADAGASDKHADGGAGPAPLSGIPGDAAAGAAQSSVNNTSVADVVPTPTLNVSAGVDTPEFGQGLADRVSWMVDNNLNGAKLQVNPPQLGPIEVRIAIQGGHAQVWLTSHSAVTRDALESSSPKLREMLGAQGFGQVSVDISQRSFHERPAHSQPYDWTPSTNRSPSTAAVQATASSMPRTSSGALDAYA